jgi:hypothetical protein
MFGNQKPQGRKCQKCGKVERYWLKCQVCLDIVCSKHSADVPAGEPIVCLECAANGMDLLAGAELQGVVDLYESEGKSFQRYGDGLARGREKLLRADVIYILEIHRDILNNWIEYLKP